MNRAVKKIVNKKNVPNLSKFNDIADYILNQGRKYGGRANSGAYSSESEADDLPDSQVILPEDYQDKKKDTSVAIRLHELGPRLKLKLIKVEDGICRGNVVFHAY